MESNRTASETCLDRSKTYFRNEQFSDAVRMAEKALRLYPTDEARAWLETIKDSIHTKSTHRKGSINQ